MQTVPGVYFSDAPVVERVLGCQLEPINGFHNGLLGAFWQTLGSNWLQVTDAGPIEPHIERFGDDPIFSFPGVGISFRVGALSCRLQILNQDKDRLIQVQGDRFHLNWKRESNPTYPRYEQIRSEFFENFCAYRKVVAGAIGSDVRSNQWEVTYVNHMPKGSVWQVPADWQTLFPSLEIARPVASGVNLETLTSEWHYEIPPRRGRLHVELKHGRQEQNELLVFNLTARGPLQTPDDAGLLNGLDLGHETIVRFFDECTSNHAHEIWRREK